MPPIVTSATVTLNLNTEVAKAAFHEALLAATQEVFLFNVLAEAKALSPVLAEATKERWPGENRDSIDAKVTPFRHAFKTGVMAVVFTKSGYGGFLELGTVKMSAQPYIYPAFSMHIGELLPLIKDNLGLLLGA